MIIAPPNTPSFYSMLLQKDAAEFVISLASDLSKDELKNVIKRVLVSSSDFSSDVSATLELQSSLNELKQQLYSDLEVKENFNPLYLPHEKDLYDCIEVKDNGDVYSKGFNGPFVVMTGDISDEDGTLIESKVMFREFTIPEFEDAMNISTLIS